MGHVNFTPNQQAYRFRNDDGGEASATWMAAENTAASIIADASSFRLRILVQETAGGASNNVDHALQFRRNGGDWISVTSSTNHMRLAAATGHITAGTPTTKQLAGGSGTFQPGEINDASDYDSRSSYNGNDHSEHEWILQALATGDYEFRVTLDGAVISASQTPALTATAPPAPTDAPVVSVDGFTHQSVSFSWTSVGGASQYIVEKHDGVAWFSLGSTTLLSHTDTNVQPDTTYMYRVRGSNSTGPGPVSNEVTVTTDSGPPPILTDFTEYTLGEAPPDWNELWGRSAIHEIKENPLATGGRILERITQGGSARGFLAWDIGEAHADQEVLARFMLTDARANAMRVVVRGSGSAGSEMAYWGELLVENEFRIARYSPGLATIVTMTYNYEVNVWYNMRVRAVGNTISASVWRWDEPEPSAWMLTGTDTNITTPGYVGFADWNERPYIYDSISVGLNGETAPALPELPSQEYVPPPHEGPQETFLETFENAIVGNVTPAGWEHMWNIAEAYIIESPSLSGGKLCRLEGLASNRRVMAYTGIAPTLDMDTRCRFRIQRHSGSDARLHVRTTDPGGGAQRSIFCELRQYYGDGSDPHTGEIILIRYGSTGTFLGNTAPYICEAMEWYQMRVESWGDLSRCKIWHDDEPEPTEWMIEDVAVSNRVDEPGYVGIGNFSEYNFIDYDAVSVGTNGAPAPILPPATEPDSNMVQPASSLTATQSGADVILSWTGDATANLYKVTRDGELIGETSTTSFTDVNAPLGERQYSVTALRRTT